jgi:hypothetical protein
MDVVVVFEQTSALEVRPFSRHFVDVLAFCGTTWFVLTRHLAQFLKLRNLTMYTPRE